jgi:hypothetical protein
VPDGSSAWPRGSPVSLKWKPRGRLAVRPTGRHGLAREGGRGRRAAQQHSTPELDSRLGGHNAHWTTCRERGLYPPSRRRSGCTMA